MANTRKNVRLDSKRVRLKKGEGQRSNGTYEFRWTTKDGKRHSIYAATLEQLREKETQVVIDEHDGIRNDITSKTVNDVYELWVELKRGIKDSTFKNYIYMYETFVKPTFGKKRITTVKRSDVKRFYNRLKEDRGMKVSTIDNVHNVLYQIFQFAVDDDMIRSNPTSKMMKELRISYGNDSEKRKALTVEQQKLFLSFLQRHPQYSHWYPVFYIMLYTGMRVGEVTGLRWNDIDLESEEIEVNHTLVYYNHRDEKGCYFSINTPKTAAGCRVIPMTKGVKEAFLMEKAYQEEAEIKSIGTVDGYHDFIFINKDGNVQHYGTLNKAIRRIIRDCNDEVLEMYGIDSDPILLPDFSCHTLRHTYATRLCEAGINIKVIQDVVGHADIDTTMNIYIDVTADLKKKEITTFDSFMEGQKDKDGSA